jgi:hypothetical protein
MRWKRWRTKTQNVEITYSNQSYATKKFRFRFRSSSTIVIWMNQTKMLSSEHTTHLIVSIVVIDDHYSFFCWTRSFWMHTSYEIFFILISNSFIRNFNIRSVRDIIYEMIKDCFVMMLHDMTICYLLSTNEIDALIKTSAWRRILFQSITEAQWSRVHEFFITSPLRRKRLRRSRRKLKETWLKTEDWMIHVNDETAVRWYSLIDVNHSR